MSEVADVVKKRKTPRQRHEERFAEVLGYWRSTKICGESRKSTVMLAPLTAPVHPKMQRYVEVINKVLLKNKSTSFIDIVPFTHEECGQHEDYRDAKSVMRMLASEEHLADREEWGVDCHYKDRVFDITDALGYIRFLITSKLPTPIGLRSLDDAYNPLNFFIDWREHELAMDEGMVVLDKAGSEADYKHLDTGIEWPSSQDEDEGGFYED